LDSLDDHGSQPWIIVINVCAQFFTTKISNIKEKEGKNIITGLTGNQT
jgi:hypothetical protein